MANPKGNPDSLNVIPLSEGEQSRPVRVRAEAWVFNALRDMGAAEVGKLISNALRDRERKALRDSETRNSVSRETSENETSNALRTVPPIRGKALELFNLLRAEGAVMVEDGRRYRVEAEGREVGSYAGSTGNALITKGLVVEVEPGRWLIRRGD